MRFLPLASLPLVAWCTGGELDASEFKHVVVIPDTHGDFFGFTNSLYLAYRRIEPRTRHLTESQFRRYFRDALRNNRVDHRPITSVRDVAIVQMGDLVDRGPHSYECIMVAQFMGEILGWESVRLMGNHELLSIMGESDDYVHEDDAKTFTDLRGRNAAFSPPSGMMFRELLESSLLMARLGTRLAPNRDRNPNTLFVHAGIEYAWMQKYMSIGQNTNIVFDSMDDINTRFKRLLQDPRGREVLAGGHSPLWTRHLVQGPEEIVCGELLRILSHFQVGRMIVGHTPQTNLLVNTRCGGKLVLLDTMISRYM